MQVGIDTVEIKRIDALINNKERFLERVFSLKEQDEFIIRNNKTEHIAAAFCAKEAFSKALGTGIVGFNLNEVSLLHKENGKPYLEFSGKALEIVNESGLSFDISITHTDSIATAIVIAFRGEALWLINFRSIIKKQRKFYQKDQRTPTKVLLAEF